MLGFQGCPLVVRRKGVWGKPEQTKVADVFPKKVKETE